MSWQTGTSRDSLSFGRYRFEFTDSEFGSLARYVWRYEPAPADRPAQLTREVARTLSTSAASIALSKDLKKRGWSFVGPTTVYAFMQAMGLVNDHLEGCHSRAAALQARAAFTLP